NVFQLSSPTLYGTCFPVTSGSWLTARSLFTIRRPSNAAGPRFVPCAAAVLPHVHGAQRPMICQLYHTISSGTVGRERVKHMKNKKKDKLTVPTSGGFDAWGK